jgi:hypothetical protein
MGKAFIATAPIGMNPYTVLGETDRTREAMLAMPKIQLDDAVGTSITVALGKNPEIPADSSDLTSDNKKSMVKASMARGAKEAIKDPRFPDASSVTTLRKDPQNPNVYVTPDGEQTIAAGVAPFLGNGQNSSTPAQGFMKLRSATIEIPKINNPIIKNIPGDPRVLDIDEYERGYKADDDGNLNIHIAKDTNFPSDAADAKDIQRNIFIQFEVFGPQPSPVAANCVTSDPGNDSVLKIPLQAKVSDPGAEDEPVTGNLKVTVLRSYVRKVPLDAAKPDAFVYVETRSGFTTFAKGLKKKK